MKLKINNKAVIHLIIHLFIHNNLFFPLFLFSDFLKEKYTD